MSFQKQEIQSTALIASLYFVRMCGLFIVLPILSIYSEQLQNATPFLIGLALGIYGLVQALLQIPFGWISDIVGRKPMLIVAFSLFSIGSLICALSTDVYTLIIGRALQGSGAVSGILLALVADKISTENRSMSMAIIGGTIGLSFGVALIFGPLIATEFSGQSSVFYACSILGVLALLFVIILLDNATPANATKQSKNHQPVLKNKSIWQLNASVFILHFVQMSLWMAVPTLLINMVEIDIEEHWKIYLWVVALSFVCMLPFMRYWDKRQQTDIAIKVSLSVISVGLLFMTLQHAEVFLLGLFLFFWGFNLLEATLPSLLSKISPEQSRGFSSGLYSTCQFLGVFFGAVSAGILISFYSQAFVFYVALLLFVMWFFLLVPKKIVEI